VDLDDRSSVARVPETALAVIRDSCGTGPMSRPGKRVEIPADGGVASLDSHGVG